MTEVKVSKVLHISNITHNISRFDIIDEIEKVCSVKRVFVLRPSSQALVEMHSVVDATTVVNQFKKQKLVILDNEVDIKYSRYEQLVKSEDQATPQCVLLVSIICRDNSTLTLRHFYSICSKIGCVDRIRMFIHQAGPQALVQYSHLFDCIRAKGELEKITYNMSGRRYSFEVQYSKLKELVIHKNNNYSRDFAMYPIDSLESSDTVDGCAGKSNACLRRGLSQDSIDTESGHSFASLSNTDVIHTDDSDTLISSSEGSPRQQKPSCDDHSMLRSGVESLRRIESDERSYAFPADNYFTSEMNCGVSDGLMRGDSNLSFFNHHRIARDGYETRRGSYLDGTIDSLNYGPSLRRRGSDMSCLSLSSVSSRGYDSFADSGYTNDAFKSSYIRSSHADDSFVSSLFCSRPSAMRRYTLEGFNRMMPISDLVDLLYGIDIKNAEYETDYNGSFTVIIQGTSEWSDAMLANYLCSNPVDGKVIRLRGKSEAMTYL